MEWKQRRLIQQSKYRNGDENGDGGGGDDYDVEIYWKWKMNISAIQPPANQPFQPASQTMNTKHPPGQADHFPTNWKNLFRNDKEENYDRFLLLINEQKKTNKILKAPSGVCVFSGRKKNGPNLFRYRLYGRK